MNTHSVNNAKNNPRFKYLEIAAYAVLAIGLIGHLFYIDSQISAINVALLTSGMVFGIMAAVAWTPLADRIPLPGTFDLAEVLSIDISRKKDVSNDMNDKRAA